MEGPGYENVDEGRGAGKAACMGGAAYAAGSVGVGYGDQAGRRGRMRDVSDSFGSPVRAAHANGNWNNAR